MLVRVEGVHGVHQERTEALEDPDIAKVRLWGVNNGRVRKVEMGDEEVSVIPAQQHVCNDHGIELSFFSQNDILI